LIRFHPIAIKFISLIKNDSRFHFNVIGVGAFELKEKLRDHNISNISFIDKFPSIETEKYVRKSDILYNLYGNNSIKLDFALSNKLYLAATYRKPILVFSGTYMATLSSKYNFGILVDKDLNNLTNKIIDFYDNLNLNYLNNMCSEFLEVVEGEQNNFKFKFNDFVLRKEIL
jgi:hypothetical protein